MKPIFSSRVSPKEDFVRIEFRYESFNPKMLHLINIKFIKKGKEKIRCKCWFSPKPKLDIKFFIYSLFEPCQFTITTAKLKSNENQIQKKPRRRNYKIK